MKKWIYYLHENGDLISKNPVVDSDPEYFDSPFVKKVWRLDLENRGDAWNLILEALVLNADVDRVRDLAAKWHMTKEDGFEMMFRIKPTADQRKGLEIFCDKILRMPFEKFLAEFEDKYKKGGEK